MITARPLAEVAPLERARMPGRLIVQWDREAVEGAGLVKIDLLGLGMLGVIDRCFDLIAQQTWGGPLQRAGERPALHGFRCDDPAVYALLCAADTVGVFQVESRAQISACLPHLQPRCYEDLIVAVDGSRPSVTQRSHVSKSDGLSNQMSCQLLRRYADRRTPSGVIAGSLPFFGSTMSDA